MNYSDIQLVFAAQMLGFDDFIPPFAEARGSGDVFNGVNYASGSAGIRSETGEQLVHYLLAVT